MRVDTAGCRQRLRTRERSPRLGAYWRVAG
jgi:hypothetical protein